MPGGAGGALTWSLLWQCRIPLTLEVFLDGIHDFLVEMLLHLCITRQFPQQLSQLVDIMVDLCYLLSHWVCIDEFYCGWLCLQILYRQCSHLLQWMAWSCSFCPMITAWTNILCNRKLQWSPKGTQHWCSVRQTSTLSCLSASQTDIFFLLPASWLQWSLPYGFHILHWVVCGN